MLNDFARKAGQPFKISIGGLFRPPISSYYIDLQKIPQNC